jgi:hypothetical protein
MVRATRQNFKCKLAFIRFERSCQDIYRRQNHEQQGKGKKWQHAKPFMPGGI